MGILLKVGKRLIYFRIANSLGWVRGIKKTFGGTKMNYILYNNISGKLNFQYKNQFQSTFVNNRFQILCIEVNQMAQSKENSIEITSYKTLRKELALWVECDCIN